MASTTRHASDSAVGSSGEGDGTGPQRKRDALETYRYLRIGMVGAVVLLAVSIRYEQAIVDCWQTSISAYYYTPVRAIFVGSLIAVGLSLIVYKGETAWEDMALTFAGMLAPIVAIAPTTDVGNCWSTEPTTVPVLSDGTLAPWVIGNIDNNFAALLVIGVLGVIVSLATRALDRVTVRAFIPGLAAITMVAIGYWLWTSWSDFYTRAHGYAALLMFGFLVLAIAASAVQHCRLFVERDSIRKLRAIIVGCWQANVWFRWYSSVALAMVGGALVIWLTRYFGDHTVFALEIYEIALFAFYWILQTWEKWGEAKQQH